MNIKEIYTEVIRLWKSNKKIKFIAIAFIVYIIFTIVVMIVNQSNETIFTDKNFYTSFIASSWEDIMFFGIVGLSLALVSLKHPRDDIFVERIRNLFSFKQNINKSVEYAVIDSIRKVAIYSPVNNIKLTISEYNSKNNAIKIIVNQEIKLTNLLHDEPYSYPRLVKFDLDDFSDSDFKVFGRILDASFTNDSLVKTTYCESNKAFKEKKYSFEIGEKLQPNGMGVTTLNYWLWYKDNEDWFFKIHHHTEKVNITISVDDAELDDKFTLIQDMDEIKLNSYPHKLKVNDFYPINSKIAFKIKYSN